MNASQHLFRIRNTRNMNDMLESLTYLSRDSDTNPYDSLFNRLDTTSLPVYGNSPWGGTDNPEGVWSWNEERDEVIVEDGVVNYDEARAIYA